MLNNKEFDLWADDYDKIVNLCDEENEYPFAGYRIVLTTIYNQIKKSQSAKILDLGFGTSILTQKLYDEGYDIYGIDFSEKMIEIARAKMPKSYLIQHDFTKGLPDELCHTKFDYVISTYAIHHLDEKQKTDIISELYGNLNPNGKIIFGDVVFETLAELEQCRTECGNSWDSDEFYLVVEQLKAIFPNTKFIKSSFCSGVLLFTQ